MTIHTLEKKAVLIRESIIKMLLAAGSGHSAGPLGLADVFTALYFRVLNHNPKNPKWESRDRLILSNGHVVPVWYATLAEADYFPKVYLKSLRQIDSGLQGHPQRGSVPGVENTAGPLGQGVSIAVGRALAAKLAGKKHRIFCVASDGEQNEGQVWEAYLLASKYHLSNLTFILDRNNIQIDGFTENVLPLEPLRVKYEAFGLHVFEVDGHSMGGLIDVLQATRSIYEKPSLVIAHTIPGKGVDFMEFKPEWHGQPPNTLQAHQALRQLRTLEGRIKSDHD